MVSTTVVVFGNRYAQIVFDCLFSVGIIVSNFLVIGVVLSKKELRHNSKYVLVALLALTELYLGLFYLPVGTNTLVTMSIDYTCAEILVLQGGPYIKIAMSCLAVVAIHIDTILQITYKMYKGIFRVVTTCILALFFLVGPFIVLIPIFINGQAPAFVGSCQLGLEVSYARAATILAYWVPAACVVVTTIVVCVVHKRAKRLQEYSGQPQTSTSLPGGTNLADLVIVAVVTVALNLPFYALSVVGCSYGTCPWSYYLNIAFRYISHAGSFTVPLAWFANKDFRISVRGRRTPANQPLLGPPPPYYGHSEYMTSPVQGQTYQNNGFHDSFQGKQ